MNANDKCISATSPTICDLNNLYTYLRHSCLKEPCEWTAESFPWVRFETDSGFDALSDASMESVLDALEPSVRALSKQIAGSSDIWQKWALMEPVKIALCLAVDHKHPTVMQWLKEHFQVPLLDTYFGLSWNDQVELPYGPTGKVSPVEVALRCSSGERLQMLFAPTSKQTFDDRHQARIADALSRLSEEQQLKAFRLLQETRFPWTEVIVGQLFAEVCRYHRYDVANDLLDWTQRHHPERVSGLVNGEWTRAYEDDEAVRPMIAMASFFSVSKREHELARRMVGLGADVYAIDGGGESALDVACEKNKVGLVRTLLELGADPQRINGKGRHALQYVKPESTDLLAVLQQHVVNQERNVLVEAMQQQADPPSQRSQSASRRM